MSMHCERPTLHIIPHTHWEGAVFQTREQYLTLGLPNILRALALLQSQPEFRFALDQVAYVEPFLTRHPEAREPFERFVREGRLALVGATDVMLDGNMPGGESFVRQLRYGKRWFREVLGEDITIGWQLDTFGHHAQIPQLWRLAGMESYWFFRGVPSWETPPEFLWEGLDGTRIRAIWLPESYAIGYGAPPEPEAFAQFARHRWEVLGRYYGEGVSRPAPAGADVCQPEEHIAALVGGWNADPEAPFLIRLSTPQEYEAATPQPTEASVVAGELNPIFQGAYSSRIELKQITRETEALLLAAGALGAMLTATGESVDDAILWRAWEPLLFNQAHDLMSGVMTDHVYEDTIATDGLAWQLARAEVRERARRYAQRVGCGATSAIVLNTLGWERTGIAQVTLGLGGLGWRGVRILDPEGSEVASEILHAERMADGSLASAEVAFVASGVPSLGHAAYGIAEAPPTADAAVTQDAAEVVLDSGCVRVAIDGPTGTITSLRLLEEDWEALAEPANLVVREADHGDLWEPYRPLDGASRVAMREPHPLPPRGGALFSDECPATSWQTRIGPLSSEYRSERPFGERGSLATSVRVWRGSAVVELHTEITVGEPAVRYRVAFPTALDGARATHEIPFGAHERPEGIEYPAQNWVDVSDGEHGLLLLNRGLPGHALHGGTLLLSLCRSTSIVAYGFGGGYEPGMTSDTGLELGRTLRFDYALLPHRGDWRDARAWREGQAYQQRLLAVTSQAKPGPLAARGSHLGIDALGVTLSSAEACDRGGWVVRLYEAAGEAAPEALLRLPEGAFHAELVDLSEEPIGELAVESGAAVLSFRPFEIKTVRIW